MQPLGTQNGPLKTADSNLKLAVDSSVKNSDVNLPDLNSIRHDRFIQQQVGYHIRQLSGLDKKVLKQKSSRLGGKLTCTSNNVSNGHMNFNQLNITQWMAGFCRIMKTGKCKD